MTFLYLTLVTSLTACSQLHYNHQYLAFRATFLLHGLFPESHSISFSCHEKKKNWPIQLNITQILFHKEKHRI